MSRRILIVEDDAGIGAVLVRGLQLAGYRTSIAPDLASARGAWDADAFDLVLLDVMLPDGDGLDLLAERRAAGDATPAIVLSAREEAELSARAHAAGVTALLPKPFVYADLLSTVRSTIG